MPKESNGKDRAPHDRSWTTAITEHDFGSGTPRQHRGDYRDGSHSNPSQAPTSVTAQGRSEQDLARSGTSASDGNARQAQLQSWLGSLYPSAQVYPGNRAIGQPPAEFMPAQLDPRNQPLEEDVVTHLRTYSPFSTYIRALPAEPTLERSHSAAEREPPVPRPTYDVLPRYPPPEGFVPMGQGTHARPDAERLQSQDVSYPQQFQAMQRYPRMTQVVAQDGRAYYMIPAAEMYPHEMENRAYASTGGTEGQDFAQPDQRNNAPARAAMEPVEQHPGDWHPGNEASNPETHAQALSAQAHARSGTSGGRTPRKRNAPDTSERCHCKKSQCLKMYCVCFAQGVFCKDDCQCADCHNKVEFLENVSHAKMEIKRKNPHAFESKLVKVFVGSGSVARGEPEMNWEAMQHKIGCKCSRTRCMKKYCECYRASVPCSLRCVCVDCRNPFGQAGVTHDGQSIRMVPVATAKPHDRAHSTGLEYIVRASASPTPPPHESEGGKGTLP